MGAALDLRSGGGLLVPCALAPACRSGWGLTPRRASGLASQFDQCLREDSRSGRQLRRFGVFRRIVTDTLATGDEDHPGRTDRRHELSIVERAGGQADVPVP